jgi:hypothetical protein
MMFMARTIQAHTSTMVHDKQIVVCECQDNPVKTGLINSSQELPRCDPHKTPAICETQ